MQPPRIFRSRWAEACNQGFVPQPQLLANELSSLQSKESSKRLKARGDVGLTYRYCGTTSGGMRRRGGQHLADLKAGLEGKLDKDKTSHMLHHIRESHPGENPRPRWGMKMIKTYSTTFKRLLAELVHIKYLAKDPKIVLLNQKCGGYQGYQLPRLSVQWLGLNVEMHMIAQNPKCFLWFVQNCLSIKRVLNLSLLTSRKAGMSNSSQDKVIIVSTKDR